MDYSQPPLQQDSLRQLDMTVQPRPAKFIVVQNGMPYVSDELPPEDRRLSRLSIIRKTWEVQHVFSETDHYRYVVDTPPRMSAVQRFLARTIYNPTMPVSLIRQRVGDFRSESLISAVKCGLEVDDDIIQQWFNAGQILRLLNAARSWPEILLAVEAIGGSHEVSSDVQEYVEQVLGKDP